MSKKWTAEMKEKLINMYPSATWEELIKEFHISKSALISMASKIGIKRAECGMSNYTTEEDEIIIHCLDDGKSMKEIQHELPWRTISSIKNRSLRIYGPTRMRWTQEENDRLKDMYSIVPLDDLLEYFPNRSRDAIIIHAGKLGLHAFTTYPDYTEEDNEFIKNNYLIMTDAEIGRILGRSKQSIKNHRNDMGLHRINKNNTAYENTSIYIRRHNKDWKYSSMKNCNFKCIITGERFDEIHHLVSLNTILKTVYKKLNIDINAFDINDLTEYDRCKFLKEFYEEQSKYPLGVCLKKEIHMQFHNYYGYGDNTVEQFYEFIEKFYPNINLNNIVA